MIKMDESQMQDICRVCRSEATPEKPLYHPCICTGSIKFIHQECLLQWLKYSRKEYCELCNHRFSFMPIYSPDMPKRLPIKDIFSGLLCSLGTAVRFWLHYTLVAVAWLGIVPLTACRIYRCLFTGSLSSILSLPLDMLSTENILSDSLYGCCVVTCTLCAFISLVWLREQILHGGGPEWLDHEHDHDAIHQHVIDHHHHHHIEFANNNVQANAPPPVPENVDDDGNEGNNAQADVNNWNPIEWDHAAEELTWERLLGLDGSLVFLEHVFWVVSLNTLFIVVFAFC
ncbi:E3 ubiquitin-protein ligase MARCH6, partial [Stegodyphus mimosarum]